MRDGKQRAGRVVRLLFAAGWLPALIAAGCSDGGEGGDETRVTGGAGGETAAAASGTGGAPGGAAGVASSAAGEAGQGSLGGPGLIEPGPEGVAMGEDVGAGDAPRTNILAIGALQILQRHCGTCHSGSVDAGRIGDVTDLPGSIARGLIVPGSSATSPLLAPLRNGHLQGPYRAPLTEGESLVLATFIDGLSPAPAPACDHLAFVSNDGVYAALAADIAAQPAEKRPFVRYIGLHYASNARFCGALLERQRYALFKAINSVSLGSDVAVPVAIDGGQLIYRIDLRDYGWDRPIDLEDDGTVDHADGWQAIVAASAPFALELAGPDADVVKRETRTAVTYLPLNTFVHATQAGDLYYALTGARQNMEATRLELGFDLRERFASGASPSAGLESGDALVSRTEQSARPGRFYWVLDVQQTNDSETLYNGPMDNELDWRQSIFHLPNGLQAYAVETRDGQRLAQMPVGCVGDCYQPSGVNAAACHACHAAGLLPVEDVMRDYVSGNLYRFDSDTQAMVPQVYLPRADFDALMASDSELHQSALERAGIARGAPDAVSSVFFGFELEPLDMDRVSAELMVPWRTLRDGIPAGDLALGPLLEGAAIPRADFAAAFPELLCAYGTGVNRPVGCL